MPLLSALPWPIRLLLAAVVAVGAGTGVFLLVRASGNESNEQVAGLATGTPPAETAPLPTNGSTPSGVTSTQPSPTDTPATESPTATETPGPSLNPPVDCGGPRYRLNVKKLRAQPGMAEAVITEVDVDTVRIDIQGVDFLITGWGKGLTFGGYAPHSDELFEQVALAAQAVQFEC